MKSGSLSIIEKYSFIIRTKNRRKVLEYLGRAPVPQTPTSIKQGLGMSLNVVSRALRELDRAGLIVCRTPKLTMGRLYEVSDQGKEILKLLDL